MHLPAAASSLDRLVTLTSPGAPVAPVVEEMAAAGSALGAARAGLEQAEASAQLLGELDRITGAVRTLRNSLAELAAVDGMTTFDPAFAADDASWDAWFRDSAVTVRQAEAWLAGQPAPRAHS